MKLADQMNSLNVQKEAEALKSFEDFTDRLVLVLKEAASEEMNEELLRSVLKAIDESLFKLILKEVKKKGIKII